MTKSANPHELIPVADPAALALGVGRRSIGRRIKDDPDFPKVLRSNGRLYVTRADLETYKNKLISRGLKEEPYKSPKHSPKPEMLTSADGLYSVSSEVAVEDSYLLSICVKMLVTTDSTRRVLGEWLSQYANEEIGRAEMIKFLREELQMELDNAAARRRVRKV